ncbi:MAG: AIPR family protein [Acidobacteria bacterium]|nr:AIPR family protein [Acidobacteriota bacterium]
MSEIYTIHYNSLRNVTPPEEAAASRRRYCGNAGANQFFDIPDDLNIRDYLQEKVDGKPVKKETNVNKAIRDQLDGDRSAFPILNGGITLITREVVLDDKDRRAKLSDPSIINGTQTRGVLRDYFSEHPEDAAYPSVNFEIIVCTDERLAAEITIARNYQNAVLPVSTYGARGVFDDLEAAIQQGNPSIKLRKSETDVGDNYLDTEKLIQVITAMIPSTVPMARPLKGKGGSEGIRVYAYSQKATCLKDFAEIAKSPTLYPEAKRFFEDVAWDAWQIYKQLRSYNGFSVLRSVTKNKNKEVAEDGVPAGIVFPILSALGKLTTKLPDGRWQFKIPDDFDLDDLCKQAKATYTVPGPGQSNPQVMGKELACYLNLHAIVDAYLKYRRP